MRQLLERLSDNWVAKALCLVIALLVYFFYHNTSLERASFVIPLQVVENGSMTAALSTSRPARIRVSVRTRGEQLPAITEGDFKAFVDITAVAEEGVHTFPVQVQTTDRLLLLDPLEVSTNIRTVSLTLEEKKFRYVEVSPSIAGSPAYGYKASQVTVAPSSLKVSGPRSLVESLAAVPTEKVDIEGITQSSIQSVRPVNENSLLDMDTATPVVVTVNLEAAGLTKSFADIPVRCVNLADGLVLRNGPFTVSVTVEGELLEMENFDSSLIFAEADCRGIVDAGSYNVPVMVKIPSTLLLNRQSVSSVGITVERKPEPEPEDGGADAAAGAGEGEAAAGDGNAGDGNAGASDAGAEEV